MVQLPSMRAASAEDSIGEIVLGKAGSTLAEIEAEAVRLTLAHTRGNRSAAARMLGISRPTLARILRPSHLTGDPSSLPGERHSRHDDLDDEAIA
jgi:DNA-binding NtrC family response regulator